MDDLESLDATIHNALNSLHGDLQKILVNFLLARATLEEWVSKTGHDRNHPAIFNQLCRYLEVETSADCPTALTYQI